MKPGFTFVEIVSPCPTNSGRFVDTAQPSLLEAYEEQIVNRKRLAE